MQEGQWLRCRRCSSSSCAVYWNKLEACELACGCLYMCHIRLSHGGYGHNHGVSVAVAMAVAMMYTVPHPVL